MSNENKSLEENIYPLEYLFEALFNSDKEYLQDIEIRYISDITEQNYNGVYADTICTIDGTEIVYDENAFYALYEPEE